MIRLNASTFERPGVVYRYIISLQNMNNMYKLNNCSITQYNYNYL